MCYPIKNQQRNTGITAWLCCHCKNHTNKLTETTCKGCNHERCTTFNKTITIKKIQTSSTYGRTNTTTQYEQAKTTFNLLLQIPIQNQEFLIHITTLQHILDISQNGPPLGQGDNSINETMWNKLSNFLKTCQNIISQRYYIDELFRLNPNPITLFCPICDEPQFQTPSGPTCKNGHGGVDGIPQK
jgi:hypothetical protein